MNDCRKLKKIGKDCFILLMLVLTIIAFCSSDYVAKCLRNSSLGGNGVWLYYLLLIFPIVSAVQLLMKRNENSKGISILIAAISFCGLLIFLNGWSAFNTYSQYKNIYQEQMVKYEKLLSFKFPRFGQLEKIDSSFYGEDNMTETTMIRVQYDNTNSIHTFEKNIINNEKWIRKDKLDKKLDVLATYRLNEIDESSYYLIYNQTTKEFNRLPKIAGKYHIYVLSYDMNKRILYINNFKYNYQWERNK